MELNVCHRGEPSHIHIRRPSRDQTRRPEASDEQAEADMVREADDQPTLA
jgi:hypothetical protein